MTENIIEAWEKFKGVLKLYGKALSRLNPPCSIDQINEVEKRLDFELPHTLKAILLLNNGQWVDERKNKSGIFKSISGWDKYEKHVFLGVQEIEMAYKVFINDKELIAEFGTNEIPFAVAGSPTDYSEAFCINASTYEVSLMWTEYIDPFNPPGWQLSKFNRGLSLIEFIQRQTEQYR